MSAEPSSPPSDCFSRGVGWSALNATAHTELIHRGWRGFRFALRSHTLAAKAAEAGMLKDIIPVKIPGKAQFQTTDNGVRRLCHRTPVQALPQWSVGTNSHWTHALFRSVSADPSVVHREACFAQRRIRQAARHSDGCKCFFPH